MLILDKQKAVEHIKANEKSKKTAYENILAAAEIRWLDDYHARVAAALTPELDEDARAWLRHATAPI